MTISIRADPGFEEWVQKLDISVYYIGIYILIIAGGIVMITSFIGCCASLTESNLGLMVVSYLSTKLHTYSG